MRSYIVVVQGGINVVFGNMYKDDWRWYMYDIVKGFDWFGDQDVIYYMICEVFVFIIEFENYGCFFFRIEDGKM